MMNEAMGFACWDLELVLDDIPHSWILNDI